MADLFAILYLLFFIVTIVVFIKMLVQKKKGEDYSNSKIVALISMGCFVVFFILTGVTNPQTTNKENNYEANTEKEKNGENNITKKSEKKMTTEEKKEEDEDSSDFDVFVNASGVKDGNGIKFIVDTNMPDETELNLTLSSGDYNSDSAFTAQTKVTVVDGKVTSDAFSDKGKTLEGDYDLCVSMSLPSLQSDSVRKVIGENGEHMKGSIVDGDILSSGATIRALFSVSIGDDIKVQSEDEYKYTIFRKEEAEEEPIEEDVTEQKTDSEANKEFISKYETDIVVAAKMALDNFIANYKLSLAPQKWTIAKFDSTETTVIAMTDIKYQDKKGKYIYVGTLNINSSGKVESAKPHYLEVNGVVLGDDGYCDDVFDKLRNMEQ